MLTVADLIVAMRDEENVKLSAFGKVRICDSDGVTAGEVLDAWVDCDGELRIEIDPVKPDDKD